jgi:hypothetical protein
MPLGLLDLSILKLISIQFENELGLGKVTVITIQSKCGDDDDGGEYRIGIEFNRTILVVSLLMKMHTVLFSPGQERNKNDDRWRSSLGERTDVCVLSLVFFCVLVKCA